MEGQKGYTNKVLGAVLGTEEMFNKWLLLLLAGFLPRSVWKSRVLRKKPSVG